MTVRQTLVTIIRQWAEDRNGAHETPEAMADAYREEILNEQGPGDQETLGEAVVMYRNLRDTIVATMEDPNDWDGDGDEGSILGNYVRWLADGKPDGGNDFFQKGRTYQRSRWKFQCESVGPEPFTGSIVALGFLFREEDGTSSIQRMREDDWAHGEWIITEKKEQTS